MARVDVPAVLRNSAASPSSSSDGGGGDDGPLVRPLPQQQRPSPLRSRGGWSSSGGGGGGGGGGGSRASRACAVGAAVAAAALLAAVVLVSRSGSTAVASWAGVGGGPETPPPPHPSTLLPARPPDDATTTAAGERPTLPLPLPPPADPVTAAALDLAQHGLLGARDPVVSALRLRRSLVYGGGANARARRVLRELLLAGADGGSGSGNGNNNNNSSNTTTTTIKIGAVGGSITAGAHASAPGANDWFAQVVARLKRAFPRATIAGRNGALSAAPSGLMDFCLDKFVDPDVDLVFVEYCANDGPITGVPGHDAAVLGGYERLLRRVLNLPSRPAVVLVQSMAKGMMFAPSAEGRRGFLDTREDSYGALAQYYDLPWLSVRALLWPPESSQTPQPQSQPQSQPLPPPPPGGSTPPRTLLSGGAPAHSPAQSPYLSHLDNFHPNDRGHTAMADMVAHWLQATAASLAQEPFGADDARLASGPLPAPAVPGNHEARNLACEFGPNLVRNAADISKSRGFAVVDEGVPGRPKVGLRAQAAGAKLLIRVNTTRGDGGGDPSAKNTTVLVAYQESWRPMGNARIYCVPGRCACEPAERVAAHNADPSMRQTVAAARQLSVTQSAGCEIAVEVLPEPGPEGSHVFTVVGIMANEYEGAVRVFGEAQR